MGAINEGRTPELPLKKKKHKKPGSSHNAKLVECSFSCGLIHTDKNLTNWIKLGERSILKVPRGEWKKARLKLLLWPKWFIKLCFQWPRYNLSGHLGALEELVGSDHHQAEIILSANVLTGRMEQKKAERWHCSGPLGWYETPQLPRGLLPGWRGLGGAPGGIYIPPALVYSGHQSSMTLISK